MISSAFKGIKPLPQLMMTLFVILVSFMLTMFLAVALSIPFWGTKIITEFGTIQNLDNPSTMQILKYLQTAQTIGLFIIPPLFLAWLFSGKIKSYLFLNRSITSRSILLVALLMIVSMPLINFIGEWNSQMKLPEWLSGVEQWMRNAEINAAELTEAFLKMDNIGALLFNLIMIAILPALGEELLFRGVIQRILIKLSKNIHWGIWISAALFSALHLQFYGFIPRLMLGALFGYLLIWSGSIWLPIAAHLFNNGFAVIAMYLIDRDILPSEVKDVGATGSDNISLLFSIAFVIFLLLIIKRNNRNSPIQPALIINDKSEQQLPT